MALAVIAGVVSWHGLRDAIEAADISRVSNRLFDAAPVDAAVLKRVAALARRAADQPDCWAEGYDAAASIAFIQLARQNIAIDYEGWTSALDDANRIVHHSLVCSPSDGRMWALLAESERQSALLPQRLDRYLTLSGRLAPSEGLAILARFRIWRSNADWLPQVAPKALSADVGTVLALAWPRHAADILGPARGAVGEAISAQISGLPPERRAALEAAKVLRTTDEPADSASAPMFEMLNSPRPR